MVDDQQHQDSVYGASERNPLQNDLANTDILNRTREITHLGLASLLFDNAEHSRYSHNAGASILFSKFSAELGLGKKDCLTGEAAAMLHDAAHMPYSHAAANYFEKKWGYTQESLAKKLITEPGQINDILLAYDINPIVVADLIFEKDFFKTYNGRSRYLKQLIAGDLDVDRIDFLCRDAVNTAPFGKGVDWQRLIKCAKRVDHQELGDIIVYDEDSIPAVGNFFSTYFSMYQAVYLNPTVKAFEEMLDRAFFLAHEIIEEKFKDYKDNPSQIGEKKLRETLLDLKPDEPNHHIAKDLINAIFKEKKSLLRAAQLVNGYQPDMEIFKKINEKFPYDQHGQDPLETRLIQEIKGAHPGEIIVIRNPSQDKFGSRDVFFQLRDSGFRKKAIVSVDQLPQFYNFKKSHRHRYLLHIITKSSSFKESIPKVLNDLVK